MTQPEIAINWILAIIYNNNKTPVNKVIDIYYVDPFKNHEYNELVQIATYPQVNNYHLEHLYYTHWYLQTIALNSNTFWN